jgi:hypothetical protein
MAAMALVFRYNVEDTKAQELSRTLEALEQKPCDVPIEYMRAWLSHMTNGEFDPLPPEQRDY